MHDLKWLHAKLGLPNCGSEQSAGEDQASIAASLLRGGNVAHSSSAYKMHPCRRPISSPAEIQPVRHTESYHWRTPCGREATQHKERCICGRRYGRQADLHCGEQGQAANVYWSTRQVRVRSTGPIQTDFCEQTCVRRSRQWAPRG